MTRFLDTADYIAALDAAGFDSPLPDSSVASIIEDANNGIELGAIVEKRKTANSTERTTFGSLADIQYIAQYALAIKTIYEVIIFFGERPEIERIIEEAQRRISKFTQNIDSKSVSAICEKLLKRLE